MESQLGLTEEITICMMRPPLTSLNFASAVCIQSLVLGILGWTWHFVIIKCQQWSSRRSFLSSCLFPSLYPVRT